VTEHAGERMMPTIEAIRDEIRREERVTGLRSGGNVTDTAIRRRRAQIALVAVVVLTGLVLTTVVNDLWTTLKNNSSVVDVDTARFAMLVFSIAFIAYAMEKEMHLRRLSLLGHEVRDLDLRLAERILESAVLADADRAVSSSLDLDGVLHSALEQGAAMVDAAGATVSVLTGDGHLREVASLTSGGSARVADGILMQVALTREPLLVSGPVPLEFDGSETVEAPVTSVVCVPLVCDEELLGVMTLAAHPRGHFDRDTLELVRRFASGVGASMTRSRRFEAAVTLADSRGDPMVDEVRTLSATIRAAAAELRSDVSPERRSALLDVVDSAAGRLLATVH
jgi:hypothetical protein